ncbi:DUF6624 domain-containing protein [Oceanicaulis alexandrii]|uniref:DUF6624 domain-containing protein n=1 Tax=Oceanicaulis alexandrii TaxID=153233 RepID=UPI0003B5A8B9|nr:DUF6624 domain-containing protein [Oceanicaulis alexandrii]
MSSFSHTTLAFLIGLSALLGACSAQADPGDSNPPSADDMFDAYLEEDRALASNLRAITPDATLEILRQRTERDQRVRMLMLDLLETPGAGPNEATLTWLRLIRHMNGIDRDNATWLKARLVDIDWFTRSDYGEQADNDAFLIVQHATHDPEFMRDVHARFARLTVTGEVAPDNYALLTDRLAVMDGAPQPYGSQFECADGEQRLQTPLADPEPVVDQRRAEVGLPPLAHYIELLPDCSTLPGGG